LFRSQVIKYTIQHSLNYDDDAIMEMRIIIKIMMMLMMLILKMMTMTMMMMVRYSSSRE